ncbi:MAG: twin-arginine translocation signal domain-containing protein, partial [Verrucomicrobiota bacterium]
MRRRNFLKAAAGAGVTAAMAGADGWVAVDGGRDHRTGPAASPETGLPEAEWPTVSALVDDACPTYRTTWDDVGCRTLMQGAYLGNGDLGVHLGGTEQVLRFYLGKNGFHAGNDVAAGRYNQHILNLARLTVEAAATPTA